MVQHNLPIVVSRLFNYREKTKRNPIIQFFKRIPVIEPDTTAWIAWRIILTFYIIFFLFDVTLLLTFGQQFWGDEAKLVVFRVFYFVGVAIIGLDVFLEFHVGYYQRGVLHKNRKDIFQKKIFIIFTVDVFTLIILILSFFIYNWKLSVLRAIFFIKLFRLKDINRQFQNLCLLHRRVRLIYQISKITLIFILYCHVIGCIFYGVDLLLYNNVDSYVQNEYLWILNCPAYPNIVAEPWDIKYLYSFYWAIASTSTVGYGDIYPKNPVGNFLIVLSNISICIIFGIFARTIITAFSNYNKISNSLKQQLRMLKQYFIIKRISKELSRKIRRFIQFKTILEGYKQESKIEDFKSKLSPQIKSKLCFVLYKSFLTNLPFIKDQNKLMELSVFIKQQTFFEGEMLRNVNGEKNIYYIKQGYVSSYYQLHRSVYNVGLLSAKNKFRVYQYFSGFHSQKQYKFVTHSEILVLEGGLLLESISKEKLAEIKTEMLLHGCTQSLGITCFICEQYHLEHNCPALFLQKTHQLSNQQQTQNQRMLQQRKNKRFRITDGIGAKSVREPLNIDRVCNFKKYYSSYNILV